MADLAGRAPAVVELAVQDETSADTGADPDAEQVLVRSARAATVLAEHADADVVVDRDRDAVHLLGEERAELDAVSEAGDVRRERHHSGH